METMLSSFCMRISERIFASAWLLWFWTSSSTIPSKNTQETLSSSVSSLFGAWKRWRRKSEEPYRAVQLIFTDARRETKCYSTLWRKVRTYSWRRASRASWSWKNFRSSITTGGVCCWAGATWEIPKVHTQRGWGQVKEESIDTIQWLDYRKSDTIILHNTTSC